MIQFSQNIQILNSNFFDNNAYSGSSLYLLQASNISLDNLHFKNNSGFLQGGAGIFSDTTNLIFQNSIVETNKVEQSTGGILFQNNLNTIIKYLTVLNNTSAIQNGGFHFKNCRKVFI